MIIETGFERPLMSEQISSADELRSMRDELFEQIAAMATDLDKAKAAHLIRRYRALKTVIETADPEPDASPYGPYKRVREAMLKYLDTHGASEDEAIVEGLWEGGFKRMPTKIKNPTPEEIEEYTKTRIRKSIGFHLDNYRGVAAEIIRRKGDLIGRFEWDDAKFEG